MKYPESESVSETVDLQEQLSALHDGELSGAQAAALVRASLADESIMLQWRSMSAIGSVLREQQGSVTKPVIAEQPALPQVLQREASNDGIFRWKMVAGFAALAAVGSLVWGLLGAAGDKAGLPQGGVLASNQTAPAATAPGQGLIAVGGQVAGQEVTMIRDPRLDELLAAHKQFGGISALQQPAGSLRSVSLATSRP
jgi:sigma-E factor negative regulatory protein RseA